MSEPTLAEICAVACAEAWRGDGEILASPIGTIPTLGARLAALTFEPDLVYGDGDAVQLGAPLPIGAPPDAEKVVEAWLPFGKMFDIVWSGKRHVMMGATQIDRFGNQNIACIGPWAKPKAQLLGVRGAPGNTVNHPTSYWVPGARAARVRRAGRLRVGRRLRPRRRGRADRGAVPRDPPRRVEQGRVRLRDARPLDADPLGAPRRDRRRGAVELTGFPLVVPDDVPESRLPTDEELRLIREVLDPDERCATPRCLT